MTIKNYHSRAEYQSRRPDLRIPDTGSLPVAGAAAFWAFYDWQPVPLHIVTGVPLIKWKSSPELTHEEIFELFDRIGDCRIAIALPSNIVVLDIDHRPEEKGWQAEETLEQLSRRYALPPCPTSKTPSGGYHLWYALPEGITARNWTADHKRFPVDGVDIRTFGGLATVPPTVRQDGAYKWINDVVDIPLAPNALCNDLQPTERYRKPRTSLLTMSPRQRDCYVEKVLSYEVAKVKAASPGERNDRLFRSSARLGSFIAGGSISAEEARSRLLAASVDNGLVSHDGFSSVHATIESGFRAGAQNPRKAPGKKA